MAAEISVTTPLSEDKARELRRRPRSLVRLYLPYAMPAMLAC